MNKNFMTEASRFQSSRERKEFWCLIIGVPTAVLVLFIIYNLV